MPRVPGCGGLRGANRIPRGGAAGTARTQGPAALGVWAGLLVVLTRPPRVLQWFWLRWIGQISYGVYVIHALFGHWLHEHFSSAPVVFVLQLGITIPLAALSWYLFESPILTQKRRWPMPSKRRPGRAIAR